ncbi:MAG: hypothetical protein GXP54_11040, partial [Deltaproteobacteria bacterium]|nr:hypothetical protein [Deltaproteobacteria bacterium]
MERCSDQDDSSVSTLSRGLKSSVISLRTRPENGGALQAVTVGIMRTTVGLMLSVMSFALMSTGCDAGTENDAIVVAASFPPEFHFGASTAAHQVEGNQKNNWTWWETLPQFAGLTVEPSGI